MRNTVGSNPCSLFKGCARCKCATTPTTIWGTSTVLSQLPPLLTSPWDVDHSRHGGQWPRCSLLCCKQLSGVLSILLQGCVQIAQYRYLCNLRMGFCKLLQPIPPMDRVFWPHQHTSVNRIQSGMSRWLHSLLMGSRWLLPVFMFTPCGEVEEGGGVDILDRWMKLLGYPLFFKALVPAGSSSAQACWRTVLEQCCDH